jgi:hypothetical protein
MYRRLTAALMVLAFTCAVALAGCATSPEGKLYQGGAVSKVTAETAYQAIYAAHKGGHVDKAGMDKADAAYDAWLRSQSAYLKAAREGQYTGDAAQASAAALATLVQIAQAYKVNLQKEPS